MLVLVTYVERNNIAADHFRKKNDDILDIKTNSDFIVLKKISFKFTNILCVVHGII